jgi:hypothetical protein
MKRYKIFLSAFLLILIIAPSVAAVGDTTSAALPLQYSGSGKKAGDIVATCDAIFVGQIIAKGPVILTKPGASTHGYTVKVATLLKGTLAGEIQVSLDVRNDGRVVEVIPHVGENYIFFAMLKAGEVIAVKLLPATDANIAKVKALIAAAPAPK